MISINERIPKKYSLLRSLGKTPGYVGRSATRKLRRQMQRYAEPIFDACVSKLTKDDICIDFGANVGKFTERLAKSGAIIHAFEPDPDTFLELKRNVGHRKNVIFHNKAVGFESGIAPFYRHKDYDSTTMKRSGSSSLVFQEDKMDANFKVEVEVVSFEKFINELGGHVRMIKMDVEGAEFDILRDIIGNKKFDLFDAIFIETHERFDESEVPAFEEYRRIAGSLEHPLINLDWR